MKAFKRIKEQVMRKRLREGALADKEIEVEVAEAKPALEILGPRRLESAPAERESAREQHYPGGRSRAPGGEAAPRRAKVPAPGGSLRVAIFARPRIFPP